LQGVVAAVLLVSMMLGAGLETNRAALLSVITKSGLLFRALAANFIIVPLVAVLLSRGFRLSDSIATGLLLMAIAPGVPFLVLSGGRQRGGSHEFAIALAFLMPALSTLTIPITAELVLPTGEHPNVPPSYLLSLLIYQLVPLLAGAIMARRLPIVARMLVRPTGSITFAAFVALLTILAPAMIRGAAVIFGTFGLLAMLLTVVLSLAIGWILGGRERSYRRTLAIGTALRNPGVAMLIATARFPGTSVASGVAAYFLIQIIVTMLAGNVFKARS
jgi:BASS family bile acid:Na+ symporter